jgi:hypothetical protein
MSIQNVQNTTYNFTPNQSDLATELGGDTSAQIAAMLLEHAHESREGASEARQREEQNLAAQQAREVEMMREQAAHIRAAGVAEGVSLMVGGGLNMMAAGTNTPVLSGAAEVSKGFGKLSASIEEARGQESAADAKQAGHHASAAERRLEDIGTEAQEARELVRTVIDFLRDVGRTETATDQAAIYLRG